MSLAKGIIIFVSALFPKLPYYELKDPPDLIILDISSLITYISVDILLPKAFLTLFVSLAVRNNSVEILHLQGFSYLILILILSYFCCRF